MSLRVKNLKLILFIEWKLLYLRKLNGSDRGEWA